MIWIGSTHFGVSRIGAYTFVLGGSLPFPKSLVSLFNFLIPLLSDFLELEIILKMKTFGFFF